MRQVEVKRAVRREQRRRNNGHGHQQKEHRRDHAQGFPDVLAQQSKARRPIGELGTLGDYYGWFGGYGSRTFGLRIALAMSMTTFTTTTMIVK
jgi:hypothetical protein